MLASTLTISRSTGAALGALGDTKTGGPGVVLCHARVHAVTPRCCNSASPSSEPPGAPASAWPRSCS
jgi:hypothetical protein